MTERVTVRLPDKLADWLDEHFEHRSHGVRECITLARGRVALDDREMIEPNPEHLAEVYGALAGPGPIAMPVDAAVSTAAQRSGHPAGFVENAILPQLEARGFIHTRQRMHSVTIVVKPRAADPSEWSP